MSIPPVDAAHAQIAPYMRALEAIVYDDLMEKEGISQSLEKYDEVTDKVMADEMKSLYNARESVMNVIERTKEDFLVRNPDFMRKNRKIIRTLMSQAPRTADGVIANESKVYVKENTCFVVGSPSHALILHAWWYVRVAPDLLLDKLTYDNLDDAPVEEVARNWFAATKAIHNYVDTK